MTLSEHYGIPADEAVQDTTWIAESAERGWIAFMKDERIRRRPAERDEIHRTVLLSGQWKPQGGRKWLSVIWRTSPGSSAPVMSQDRFLYAVHASSIERLSIGSV